MGNPPKGEFVAAYDSPPSNYTNFSPYFSEDELMRYLDLKNKENYDCTIQYLLKECDEVMFYFPIIEEETCNILELADDYILYTEEKQKFLKELFAHGAVQHRSRNYLDSKLGMDAQIIKVKLYPQLVKRLKSYHLFEWLWWNVLPEDPCFFSGGECRFVTISHEEIFYICDEKKDHLLIQQL